jgi:hypothetical protein
MEIPLKRIARVVSRGVALTELQEEIGRQIPGLGRHPRSG